MDRFRGASGATLSREVVDLLVDRKIPTHPANYEIWSAHKTGAYPDLSRELDILLASGGEFTDEVNEELFERFFANTRLSVRIVEAGDTIARSLTEVSDSLQRAGADTAGYSRTLSDAASKFQAGVGAEAFLGLVSSLADATTAMAERNARLAEGMANSSREIDALQSELRTVKVQALTDGLTGIANRSLLDETLRRRVAESETDRTDLCFLLCDIDHFKRVNDTWGHAIGDQVIRFVAQQIQAHARPDWLGARYGGEEFALVMPRTSLDAGYLVATSVREAVRAKALTRRSTGDRLGAITVSIGICERRRGERVQDFVERVDACLYAAKHAGRDRVSTEPRFQVNAA